MDQTYIDILACPSCHGIVQEDVGYFVCQSCGYRYPIREGIPVMLVEEALPPVGKGEM